MATGTGIDGIWVGAASGSIVNSQWVGNGNGRWHSPSIVKTSSDCPHTLPCVLFPPFLSMVKKMNKKLVLARVK